MKFRKKNRIDQKILEELEQVEAHYREKNTWIEKKKSAWYVLKYLEMYMELKKEKRLKWVLKMKGMKAKQFEEEMQDLMTDPEEPRLDQD